MAELTGTTTEPNTPAPKKGGTSKNTFPTFTPNTTRMTRAQAKAAGVDAAIPLNLEVSVRKPKKTKIPPGVGLEQIPSPGNLKVVRKTRGAVKKEKVEVDDVIKDLGELDIKKDNKKGGASKASKKVKETAAMEEDEVKEVKAGRTTRSNTVVKHDVKNNDKVKGKGKAKGKYPAAVILDDSDEGMETFDVNPVIPPTLQSRISRGASTSKPTYATVEIDTDNEALLTSLAPFMSSKKLWEMDESDIAELRKAAEGADKDSEVEMALNGMLDVVEKFQAFRDGFDAYMEDMEVLGLGLVWEEGDEE